MKEIELFRERYYHNLEKAVVKECTKIITIKYYEFNIRKNRWDKLYCDEHFLIENDFDMFNHLITCYLANKGFVDKETFNEYQKEKERIRKWQEEHRQ